jgi:hypothetical protein
VLGQRRPATSSENRRLHREFYSVRSAVRRLPLPNTFSRLASWKVNFDQMTVGANLNSMQEFSDF